MNQLLQVEGVRVEVSVIEVLGSEDRFSTIPFYTNFRAPPAQTYACQLNTYCNISEANVLQIGKNLLSLLNILSLV